MVPPSILTCRIALLLCLALPGLARAQPLREPAPRQTAGETTAGETTVIEVFSRPGCPHCVRAAAFLRELQATRPELRFVHHDVIAEPAARQRLRQLTPPDEPLAVPAIYISHGSGPDTDGRLFIGFDQASTTGQDILAWLDRHAAAAPERVHVPWLGAVDAGELGLPVFAVVLGLADGFNPCAMWVLLFLLSLLVNMKSRARMAMIGGTFVVVSGVVYYAFMAAWLNVFLLIGMSRGVQVTLGFIALAAGSVHVKDFFAFGKGPSLSIPESARPGIYARVRRILHAENLRGAFAAVVVLAVMVNMVELLCTAGLPAIFTQILSAHGLPAWQYYLYLLLYIVAYMVDDTIMLVIAVVTLSRRKLQERGGRVLKLVSGAVMVVLGLVLVFKPGWLAWS